MKDYPGAWAEYRVYEGGYVQLTRRIDAPDALAWTEKTRGMFAGLVSRLRARRRRRPLLRAVVLNRRCPALSDLHVIDMATVFAGPGAARHLADFGADVIKVESPAGDGVRRMGWFPPEGGDSYTWKLLGRNKRAIVLDLKTDAGRDAFFALADAADVLIENFRPGHARTPRVRTRRAVRPQSRGWWCCGSPGSVRTARTRRARVSRRWRRR